MEERLLKLLGYGILPVLVFDGKFKPKWKRGVRVGGGGGRSAGLVKQIKEFCAEMGIECRDAPGEAEAELAWLCRSRQIDMVLSDDGDTLVYGALTVIRNWSQNLSGTQAPPDLARRGRPNQ